ncbi:hypothetical protein M104_1366 [Bacteroides fragilis str. 1007-1-F |uniref:Uncharacterized protein n=1 Tax=Bacteroides fragilis str. 1007-1-F \|nr:hypothetical protein M067_1071 [Bacteroides fragilis str. J-143-4]EXZ34922.1 hypothetical protein M147_1226 [Bacteroides fragilis str. 1007-1-F \
MSLCYISANLLEQFIFEYRQNDMPNAKQISPFAHFLCWANVLIQFKSSESALL